MKQLGLMLAFLVIVVLLLATKVVPHVRHPKPECATRILVVAGPHGEPVECVCAAGALSECFHPGP